MQMLMGIAVHFVVSGAMPLIFLDDVMLKSELVPVLDEELVLGLGIENRLPSWLVVKLESSCSLSSNLISEEIFECRNS